MTLSDHLDLSNSNIEIDEHGSMLGLLFDPSKPGNASGSNAYLIHLTPKPGVPMMVTDTDNRHRTIDTSTNLVAMDGVGYVIVSESGGSVSIERIEPRGIQ